MRIDGGVFFIGAECRRNFGNCNGESPIRLPERRQLFIRYVGSVCIHSFRLASSKGIMRSMFPVESKIRGKNRGPGKSKIGVKSKHLTLRRSAAVQQLDPKWTWFDESAGLPPHRKSSPISRRDLLPVFQTIHIATFLACRPLSPGATKRCRSTPYFLPLLAISFADQPKAAPGATR
jgi:hypothetical protein